MLFGLTIAEVVEVRTHRLTLNSTHALRRASVPWTMGVVMVFLLPLRSRGAAMWRTKSQSGINLQILGFVFKIGKYIFIIEGDLLLRILNLNYQNVESFIKAII